MNDYEQCKKTVGFADSKNKCNLPIGHTGMCGCTFETSSAKWLDRALSNDELRDLSDGKITDISSIPDRQE